MAKCKSKEVSRKRFTLSLSEAEAELVRALCEEVIDWTDHSQGPLAENVAKALAFAGVRFKSIAPRDHELWIK